MSQFRTSKINTTDVAASGIVDAKKELIIPTFTDATRPVATAGTTIYNSDTEYLQVYDGAAWANVGQNGTYPTWADAASRPTTGLFQYYAGINLATSNIEIYNGDDQNGDPIWLIVAEGGTGSITGDFSTNGLQVYMDPLVYSAPATQWTDSITFGNWQKYGTGTPTNPNDYTVAGGSHGWVGGALPVMQVGSGTCTYECWISFPNAGTGTWAYIFGKSSFWDVGSCGLYLNANGSRLGFHTTSTNGVEVLLANLGSIPSWKHVVGVLETNGRSLYVNGQLQASDSTRHDQTSTVAMSYGCDAEGEYNYSGFQYGRARAYNRALTASEVNIHYQNERAYYGV